MKILQINTVYGKGSTGKIAMGIHDVCVREKIECLTAYRYKENDNQVFSDTITVSSWLDCHIHNRLARCTLLQGCFSYGKTKLFLRKVKKYSPTVIHLHNLHGSYIHLSSLFRFVKKNNIPVIWTLHDCWAFTGYCPHFTLSKCAKWKTSCYHCPVYREDSVSLFDNSQIMYKLKKKWFSNIKNMTIVTPSQWLADLVKESYLKDYPIRVINNGIDLNVFKPTASDFRKKYNIANDKSIILGVAFDWSKKKGLDVFIELAKRLDDTQYQIVLVGTDDMIDRLLPENIISIHRTQDQQELAGLYTISDLFINPSREENYPTVNMEAISCGTPVLTFKTGGSPEILDEASGMIASSEDIEMLIRDIVYIVNATAYTREACLKRARGFDMYDKFEEYIKLYQEVRKR